MSRCFKILLDNYRYRRKTSFFNELPSRCLRHFADERRIATSMISFAACRNSNSTECPADQRRFYRDFYTLHIDIFQNSNSTSLVRLTTNYDFDADVTIFET